MRWLLAISLLLATPALAADDPTLFAWQPRQGAVLPLDTVLRDETGAAFPLERAFGGPPVVLDLGYHHCPTLCGVVRADLLQALRTSGLPDTAFRLVVLSIDPAETPADSATAKAEDGTGAGAHYLTGTAPAIAAVADAVGFRSKYDEGLRQFLHPAGAVVLTGAGRVSSTLLGTGFSGADLRSAVTRAAAGEVAPPPSPILLLCFHFDQATGRYTLAIEKVLRLMAGLTVLTVGGLLWVLHRT